MPSFNRNKEFKFSIEIAEITNTRQSHKSCRKYKFDNGENTDLWIYQRRDQVSRRSKRPLSIGHTRLSPNSSKRYEPLSKSVYQEQLNDWYEPDQTTFVMLYR
jgi:hypothetical protein